MSGSLATPMTDESTARCAFCGQDTLSFFKSPSGAVICSQCVALMAQVLERRGEKPLPHKVAHLGFVSDDEVRRLRREDK
jgi:hypothetical protein